MHRVRGRGANPGTLPHSFFRGRLIRFAAAIVPGMVATFPSVVANPGICGSCLRSRRPRPDMSGANA